MAKKKMPGSEKEIKSNVYLIECRSSSHRQPWQFEKRILSERWLEDIGGSIYEMFKYTKRKNLRIGCVECNSKRCHSSSHLRIVKRLYEE